MVDIPESEAERRFDHVILANSDFRPSNVECPSIRLVSQPGAVRAGAERRFSRDFPA